MNKQQLYAEIEEDEGFRSSAYKDSLGYWTIGIGTLIDERKLGGITHDEALYLLANRVDPIIDKLDQILPWFQSKPDVVQRALVNMAYQMGVSGLFGFKNTLALIEDGKYAQAADNALKSLWAQQTPNRAKRVTDMIRSAQP